ncbi:MAG: hypothetical protein ACR2QW_17115 [bacterium]
MSFFEKPLAYQTEWGTFSIRTLGDWEYRSEDNDNARFDTRQIVSELGFSTQLKNDWNVGAKYIADYSSERRDEYLDEFRVFAQDQWGLAIAGDIATQVFDQTRRQETVGLLGIENDNFTLPLESYGVYYQWSSPSLRLLIGLDEEANFEAGVVIDKPVGRFQYKLSLRVNQTEDEEGNAQGVKESEGIALMGQIKRGRWLIDVQLMAENVTSLQSERDFDLITVSSGLHYQFDRLKLSLSGVSRENVLDNTERTVALGARFDLARGLSINLGASVSDSEILTEDFKTYAASLRYEF